MGLVGDRERERAAASLKDHFAKGRISIEELGKRVELALGARSRSDLRAALSGLSDWRETNELVAAGVGVVRKWARRFVFFATAAVWALCSFALVTPFAVMLLAQGRSTAVALAFAVLWGVMTLALWRPWFRLRR